MILNNLCKGIFFPYVNCNITIGIDLQDFNKRRVDTEIYFNAYNPDWLDTNVPSDIIKYLYLGIGCVIFSL